MIFKNLIERNPVVSSRWKTKFLCQENSNKAKVYWEVSSLFPRTFLSSKSRVKSKVRSSKILHFKLEIRKMVQGFDKNGDSAEDSEDSSQHAFFSQRALAWSLPKYNHFQWFPIEFCKEIKTKKFWDCHRFWRGKVHKFPWSLDLPGKRWQNGCIALLQQRSLLAAIAQARIKRLSRLKKLV